MDLTTYWWPWPLLRGGAGVALYLPCWLVMVVLVVLWTILHRPIYRLRWREVLAYPHSWED